MLFYILERFLVNCYIWGTSPLKNNKKINAK